MLETIEDMFKGVERQEVKATSGSFEELKQSNFLGTYKQMFSKKER